MAVWKYLDISYYELFLKYNKEAPQLRLKLESFF